ncbi:gamma carbonic anhydrase family protein [Coprothermobacter platensis]|jgi:carbonic anhydrase/acetyltransferase-like protein (isoleucine patch superfamily)|uniref:gamma carbonic anhydrase family protein n=1 Tax=Coprothermobacter platensis TaxID=108819 RepID=UPI000365C530|nr:gamma carbonic anhydrase family protein [Coprothermobacter platensis]
MLSKYGEKIPVVDETAFVHSMAFVSGEVYIGKDAFILPFVSIRGDINAVYIGEGTNVQDNAIIHVTDELPVKIGDYVTVGHGAVLHGCSIGNNVLIGMGAIVLDGAVIEDNVLVAAGSLIPPKKRIPSGSLVVGNPFKIVRTLSEEEIAGIKDNALDYIRLKEQYRLLRVDAE